MRIERNENNSIIYPFDDNDDYYVWVGHHPGVDPAVEITVPVMTLDRAEDLAAAILCAVEDCRNREGVKVG